jgi:hypothetical protein
MDKGKNKTLESKAPAENSENENSARYAKSSYFLEKDKKAASFLKKYPIPAKFL